MIRTSSLSQLSAEYASVLASTGDHSSQQSTFRTALIGNEPLFPPAYYGHEPCVYFSGPSSSCGPGELTHEPGALFGPGVMPYGRSPEDSETATSQYRDPYQYAGISAPFPHSYQERRMGAPLLGGGSSAGPSVYSSAYTANSSEVSESSAREQSFSMDWRPPSLAAMEPLQERSLPVSPWRYGADGATEGWEPAAHAESCWTFGGSQGDFLRRCSFCHRSLERCDIFMYRGEKGFCSQACRQQQILIDERSATRASGRLFSMIPSVGAGSQRPRTGGGGSAFLMSAAA